MRVQKRIKSEYFIYIATADRWYGKSYKLAASVCIDNFSILFPDITTSAKEAEGQTKIVIWSSKGR